MHVPSGAGYTLSVLGGGVEVERLAGPLQSSTIITAVEPGTAFSYLQPRYSSAFVGAAAANSRVSGAAFA